MSGQCTGWVLRHGPKERAMRAVLLTIADAANRDGEHAHPGTAAMVEGSLYSLPHVKRVLRRLLEEGWLELEERGGGRGLATVYRVRMEAKKPAHLEEPDHGGETGSQRAHSSVETGSSGFETGSSGEICPLSATVSSNEQPPPTPPQAELGTALVPTSVSAAPTGGEQRVFDAWREATNRPRARLDDKRRKLIRSRLREYPEQDLIDAVRGWRHSPHHRGENDRQTVFNDLGLLLRDAANVEKFRDLEQNPPPPQLVGAKPKSFDALQRRMAQHQAAEAGA